MKKNVIRKKGRASRRRLPMEAKKMNEGRASRRGLPMEAKKMKEGRASRRRLPMMEVKEIKEVSRKN